MSRDRSCTATQSKETIPSTKTEDFDIEIIDTILLVYSNLLANSYKLAKVVNLFLPIISMSESSAFKLVFGLISLLFVAVQEQSLQTF